MYNLEGCISWKLTSAISFWLTLYSLVPLWSLFILYISIQSESNHAQWSNKCNGSNVMPISCKAFNFCIPIPIPAPESFLVCWFKPRKFNKSADCHGASKMLQIPNTWFPFSGTREVHYNLHVVLEWDFSIRWYPPTEAIIIWCYFYFYVWNKWIVLYVVCCMPCLPSYVQWHCTLEIK